MSTKNLPILALRHSVPRGYPGFNAAESEWAELRAESTRATTLVERSGRCVAALVHDLIAGIPKLCSSRLLLVELSPLARLLKHGAA